MLVLIISYKKNGKWNEMKKISENRFKQLGYKTKTIEGYNLTQHPEIKPNQVVYLNFRDKVIPYINKLKFKDGILVAEDDAYISDKLTPTFLLERLKKHKYIKNILRVGYQKVLKLPKGKSYPRGYFCVGDQLIWFPKSQMEKLERELYKSTPQHLDGFLSKNMNLKIELLDWEKQKKEKYVEEIEHYSTTIGKIRKGIKINNIKKKTRKRKTKQN